MNITERAQEGWTSRRAFILASIGSAIGLGNIWRFPYVCYQNGGGAFLVAFLIALFTAGIPLLILEFSLGHKMASGAPRAFARVKKSLEWVGWLAVLVGFVIVSYYAIIMSWSANYLVYSFNLSWGENTQDFFFNKFLKLSDNIFNLGSFNWPVIIGLVIVWILIVLCIWKGARTVSKVVYATVLLPWLILIIFVIRGVTLPGAFEGLKYYLTPDFSKLLEPGIWIAAYGQVFFSLSLGFGIMIAYASFLPRKSDIINNAFIIGLADAATAFVGGLAVFASLGYLSHVSGQPISEVVKSGPQLAFVVYPAIINNFPFGAPVFGILFFVMLLTLAIDSAFSLLEAVCVAVIDKWGISRKAANILCAGLALLAGLIFATQAGLLWLDVVDHFVNEFGLIIVAIIECVVLGWLLGTGKLRRYVNELSDFRIGWWWDMMIRFIIPVVLIIIGAKVFIDTLKEGYGDYSSKALFLGGWLVLMALPIIAIILMLIPGKKDQYTKV